MNLDFSIAATRRRKAPYVTWFNELLSQQRCSILIQESRKKTAIVVVVFRWRKLMKRCDEEERTKEIPKTIPSSRRNQTNPIDWFYSSKRTQKDSPRLNEIVRADTRTHWRNKKRFSIFLFSERTTKINFETRRWWRTVGISSPLSDRYVPCTTS